MRGVIYNIKQVWGWQVLGEKTGNAHEGGHQSRHLKNMSVSHADICSKNVPEETGEAKP